MFEAKSIDPGKIYEGMGRVPMIGLGAVLFIFVGALLPFVAKDETERRIVLNTIGPFWEGNQVWIILGAGFTPFPFKIITIASGFFGLNLPLFVVIAFLARGLRFFLLAGLLKLFGNFITNIIDRYFNILAILLYSYLGANNLEDSVKEKFIFSRFISFRRFIIMNPFRKRIFSFQTVNIS